MAYFASAGLVPRILQETTEKPAMLAMVAAGMGVALAPDWTETLSRAGVRFRPIRGVRLDPDPAGAIVGMAWRPQQRHAARDVLISALKHAAADFHPSILFVQPITRIAAGGKTR